MKKETKKPLKVTLHPDALKKVPPKQREMIMREFIRLAQSGELEKMAKPAGDSGLMYIDIGGRKKK